ncbi:MAG TPA: LuxR C-terminal-related transcriptional regulator [Streptosporangiaceae bacterium]|jgi:DNA-binding NarL/FixJ family response regulator/anti-sigma regulatory factor (Ser/Thr protein kinase)|nr:LuxR C-terminal-related transcriptional regulator [Streptosporangiaceae bacterium]
MRWATRENVSGQVRPADPAAQWRAGVPEGKSPPALGDSHHVRAAVAAERARIAREMDDTVSKSLLGISMVAASLATAPQAADRQTLEQQLRELARLARRTVADAQCVIHDLQEEALREQVRSVATAWGILTGIRVNLELAPGGEVSAEVRCEIVAILREALRNVEQHAQASQVRVVLCRARGLVVLSVADDGTGHRPPADVADLRADGCSGLAGISERARRLGGRLIVESRPGGGTRLQAEIPAPARPGPRAASVTSQVRAIVADSNPVFRLGLRTALEHAAGIEIAAEAGNGEDAVALVRRHHPDVLLLDIRMPLPDGPATISHLSRLTQVVMLTSLDDADLVIGTAVAGASGCVMREELEHGELIQVVKDVARPRPISAGPAPPDAAGSFLADPGWAVPSSIALRPREREIMGLIADGLSNRQIAARLVITEKTVKNHICSIYQRFGVGERSQAVSRWRELLSMSDSPPGTSR